jgi:hypothetical protein
VTDAFRHPGIQAGAGIGALLALTWPLFVFDRPVYVVGAFFVIWSVIIGLLFAISTAQKDTAEDGSPDAHPEEDDARRD